MSKTLDATYDSNSTIIQHKLLISDQTSNVKNFSPLFLNNFIFSKFGGLKFLYSLYYSSVHGMSNFTYYKLNYVIFKEFVFKNLLKPRVKVLPLLGYSRIRNNKTFKSFVKDRKTLMSVKTFTPKYRNYLNKNSSEQNTRTNLVTHNSFYRLSKNFTNTGYALRSYAIPRKTKNVHYMTLFAKKTSNLFIKPKRFKYHKKVIRSKQDKKIALKKFMFLTLVLSKHKTLEVFKKNFQQFNFSYILKLLKFKVKKRSFAGNVNYRRLYLFLNVKPALQSKYLPFTYTITYKLFKFYRAVLKKTQKKVFYKKKYFTDNTTFNKLKSFNCDKISNFVRLITPVTRVKLDFIKTRLRPLVLNTYPTIKPYLPVTNFPVIEHTTPLPTKKYRKNLSFFINYLLIGRKYASYKNFKSFPVKKHKKGTNLNLGINSTNFVNHISQIRVSKLALTEVNFSKKPYLLRNFRTFKSNFTLYIQILQLSFSLNYTPFSSIRTEFFGSKTLTIVLNNLLVYYRISNLMRCYKTPNITKGEVTKKTKVDDYKTLTMFKNLNSFPAK